jgi:hypothetical protein
MTAPEPAVTEEDVPGRIAAVRQRLAAAGGPDVRIVAAAKGAAPSLIDAAVRAGVVDIGASYAQELLAAAGSVQEAPRWHFIGRLQANKVRQVARLVELWQSIDRPRLVDEVARHAPGAAVLIQVDVTGDPAKGGCPPASVAELVGRAHGAGLDVQGLMAGPPTPGSGPAPFRLVTRLADDLGLTERCMGMTDDLELAVGEGSTMVRVGRGLFGPRPVR